MVKDSSTGPSKSPARINYTLEQALSKLRMMQTEAWKLQDRLVLSGKEARELEVYITELEGGGGKK